MIDNLHIPGVQSPDGATYSPEYMRSVSEGIRMTEIGYLTRVILARNPDPAEDLRSELLTTQQMARPTLDHRKNQINPKTNLLISAYDETVAVLDIAAMIRLETQQDWATCLHIARDPRWIRSYHDGQVVI